MSQVNLLPPEILQRQKVRQRTILVAIVGGAVIMVILAFFFFQSFRLSQANSDLAAQEQTNAQLETEIASLSQYGELQTQLQQKQQLETAVYQDEISWAGTLKDVSQIMPPDAQLTSFAGEETATGADEVATTTTATTTTTTTTGAPPGELVGSLTFSVTAVGIATVTDFLARVDDVRGWANSYTTSVTQTEPRSGDYTFAATADLTKEAVTARGRGEENTP